ncbi:hypothetical protein B0G84_8860 [Paraburkholderia sp. BL8N3]|nr:RpiR family transcriptional regulator [Paraburkholderia sp. BL8N3]TCK31801.1 hypothetical protein B0G84_8860 [Paraburkholderia sp. BL8N3]
MSHSRKIDELGDLLSAKGWTVEKEPRTARFKPDLLVSDGKTDYVVELKTSPEGRPDRVIALLAQAILQAEAYAKDLPDSRPLALVWTRSATRSLIDKVDEFHSAFGKRAAIGILTDDGMRHFVDEKLTSLNHDPSDELDIRPGNVKVRGTSNLFSDLNQWLLKVLLAPEIPNGLLAAPRETYRTVSQLARAAAVSPMTASRFVNALRQEGFLDRGRTLRLVRRQELSRRWKAQYTSLTPEAPARFLLPGSLESRLGRLFGEHEASIGLFDAAARLNIGHVEGVPMYLYVRDFEAALRWKALVLDERSSQPALILKQAPAPESLFRGRERKNGMFVSDVLQIWLDAASHPSRGAEQSNYLESTVLKDVVGANA